MILMMNIRILRLCMALFMGGVCFLAAEDIDRFDQLKVDWHFPMPINRHWLLF